jgi:hypothetical protein
MGLAPFPPHGAGGDVRGLDAEVHLVGEHRKNTPLVPLSTAVILAAAVILVESAVYYLLIRHQSGAFGDLTGRVSNLHVLKSTGNIYTHFDFEAFTYPPGGILLLSPLILVPLKLLAPLWSVAVLAALCATMAVAIRHVTALSHSDSILLGAAATAVSPLLFPAVYDTVFWGQIGTMVTLAVVLDFLVVRGRFQGVAVGLATTIKVYPGVLIIVWFARRQFRQAATALATVIATTAVASVLWYPSSFTFIKDKIVGRQEIGHLANGFEAQASSSIPALFLRPPYALGHLSFAQSVAISAVVGVIGVVAALGAFRRGHELTGVVLGLIISVICSPVAWNHYFAFMPLLVVLPLELGWRSWTARAALAAAAINVVPWHRWKLAGANQVLLSHHRLYLSYVAQNATLVPLLVLVLVAVIEFWPYGGPALVRLRTSRKRSTRALSPDALILDSDSSSPT